MALFVQMCEINPLLGGSGSSEFPICFSWSSTFTRFCWTKTKVFICVEEAGYSAGPAPRWFTVVYEEPQMNGPCTCWCFDSTLTRAPLYPGLAGTRNQEHGSTGPLRESSSELTVNTGQCH